MLQAHTAHTAGPPRVPLLSPSLQGVGKRKTYAGSWVESLNKAGFSCAGIDNRGCGRSSGLFGYVNDHTDWVNDVVSSMWVCQLVCVDNSAPQYWAAAFKKFARPCWSGNECCLLHALYLMHAADTLPVFVC